MKQFLRIAIFGLLTTGITGCGSDKPATVITPENIVPKVEFTISATSDTTVFGEQGSRIFIEKETFQFADGTPATDSIKIAVKEYYRKSDIVLADLSTVSGDKLLETGGMLNITATSQGKPLEIKPDKRIVVHFPKQKNAFKQMNLFYAGGSSNDSVVADWSIDTVSLVKSTIQILSWGYYWLNKNDSTPVDSRPKNFKDTGYYWSPLELYVNKFDFSKSTIEEINNYTDNYYVGIEFDINSSGKIVNPVVVARVSENARRELLNFVNGIPELTPSKDKTGKAVTRRAILGLSKGQIVPLYKSREEYLRSFDKKYARFEKQPIRSINEAELEYYIFSVAKLGWINCDRFLDAEQTVDYYVQAPTGNGIKLKMVFDDIDGVLMGKWSDGKFVFSNVPAGRQVTIVGIKNTDGQLQAAFQKLTISDKPLNALAFKETSLAQLKQQLALLN